MSDPTEIAIQAIRADERRKVAEEIRALAEIDEYGDMPNYRAFIARVRPHNPRTWDMLRALADEIAGDRRG